MPFSVAMLSTACCRLSFTQGICDEAISVMMILEFWAEGFRKRHRFRQVL